jgi:hypothetical protein
MHAAEASVAGTNAQTLGGNFRLKETTNFVLSSLPYFYLYIKTLRCRKVFMSNF